MLATPAQTEAFVNLFHKGTKLTYKKGEYVIRPGEPPSGVHYIEQGLVKAFNISKYGEENLLIIRKKHEIFPLIWALTALERDIIYQVLDGGAVVWRISRDNYMDFLLTHPDGLPPILDIITEQYRMHSERIMNLEYRTVRERLISFLITMSSRFGKNNKDGCLIDVPLRHQDIASSINASRETASRELAILERKGLLTNKQMYITVKNLDKLKTLL